MDTHHRRNRRLRAGLGLTFIALLALAAFARAPALSQEAAPEPAKVPKDGVVEYSDPRLPAGLPLRRWGMFIVSARGPTSTYGPLKDPKTGDAYRYRLVVRISPDEDTAFTVRFTVHFNQATDDHLARLVGRAMVHFYWIGRDYLKFGLDPNSNQRYDIWLTHDGEPGAEHILNRASRIRSDIYLYAVDEARAPAEWLRELAHEYSHDILPPLGPFTEPEKWADGYYGERLLMKWLIDNGFTKLWDQEIDGQAYIENQIAPLRSRFLNAGPSGPDSPKTDANGMEHYIGYLLAMEQMHELPVFRTLLYKISRSSPRPQGISLTYKGVLQGLKPKAYTVDASAFIPARSKSTLGANGLVFTEAAYWLHLTGGRWQLTLPGVLPAGVEVTYGPVKFERMMGSVGGNTVFEANISGVRTPIQWRQLVITAPEGMAIPLTKLRFAQPAAL